MAEQITIGLSVEKQVGSNKQIDFGFTKVAEVDGNYVVETILEAASVDTEFDLYVSTLITEVEFVIIQTDQPLTVKPDDIANDAIEVEDLMLLTADIAKLFITVPGSEDATVKIIHGGKQT